MQENTHIDKWTWMEDPDKIIIVAPMIANWHTSTKYHNKYCQGNLDFNMRKKSHCYQLCQWQIKKGH